MEKRLEELADQAGAVATRTVLNTVGDRVLVGEEEIREFAKLVVQECAQVINNHQLVHTNQAVSSKDQYVQAIKRHFGFNR